jgi:hypothetical protein
LFKVKLQKQGGEQTVVISDKLPSRPLNRNQRSPIYAQSKSAEEKWPSLLEKAYAKYYGGYQNLVGGFVHLGLVDLTGGVGEHFRVTPDNQDAVWTRLKSLHDNGDLIGAGSNSGKDTDCSPQGIAQGHAYAVLQVVKVQQLRLLKLRNPWGTSQWCGPYSDGDPGSLWTESLKNATRFDPSKACLVFLISYYCCTFF